MDIQSMRVRNILSNLFSPAQQEQTNPVMPGLQNSFAPPPMNLNPNTMTNTDDPNGILAGLLNPTTVASEKLNDLLASQPKREDYKPSRMTNIFNRIQSLGNSGPVGIANGQAIGYKSGGIDNANLYNKLQNRGYDEAMTDWNAKLKPLGELADSEASQNTQRRIAGTAMLRDEAAKRADTTKKNIADDKIALGREQLAEKYEYMQFLKEKASRPNAIFKSDKDGRVFSVDKNTGGFIGYVTTPEGGFVTSDKLPDEEKMQIELNNHLKVVAASGAEDRKTAATRGAIEGENIGKRGDEQRKTNAEKPASAGRTATEKHKIGDEKVFPNGKVGRWDGNGWVDTGKKAK